MQTIFNMYSPSAFSWFTLHASVATQCLCYHNRREQGPDISQVLPIALSLFTLLSFSALSGLLSFPSSESDAYHLRAILLTVLSAFVHTKYSLYSKYYYEKKPTFCSAAIGV